MTVNNTDTFLVERSGTSYKLQAQNLMANLQDTDLMLVERSGTSYKATGLDVKNSLGSDQPTYKANASGAITSGEPVVLNSNNTISGIDSTSYTEAGTLLTNRLQGPYDSFICPMAYDADEDRVFATRYSGSTFQIKIGRLNGSSGTTITWGNWTTLFTISNRSIRDKYAVYWDDNSNQLLVFCQANQSGYGRYYMFARAISSSDVISGNASADYNFGGQYSQARYYPVIVRNTLDNTIFHCVWNKHSHSSTYYTAVTTYQIGSNSVTRKEDTNVSTVSESFGAAMDNDGRLVVALGDQYHHDILVSEWQSASNTLSTRTPSSVSHHPSDTSSSIELRMVYDSGRNGFWVTSRHYAGSYSSSTIQTYAAFFTVNASDQAVLVSKKLVGYADKDYQIAFHPPSRSLILAYGGSSSNEQNLVMTYVQVYIGTTGTVQNTNEFKPNLYSGTHPIGAATVDAAFYIPGRKQILAFHLNWYWEGMSYRDRESSYYNPTYVDTNLTASNYLGIADGSFANGAEAKAIVYPGTASGQSGLSTGNKYYLQMDGTLALTADDISVVAGVAQSATTIKVQYS